MGTVPKTLTISSSIYRAAWILTTTTGYTNKELLSQTDTQSSKLDSKTCFPRLNLGVGNLMNFYVLTTGKFRKISELEITV